MWLFGRAMIIEESTETKILSTSNINNICISNNQRFQAF